MDRALPSATLLDALAELVERSLVQAAAPSGAAARYSMLETVRDYARILLMEQDGPAYARAQQQRHLEWCVELTARPGSSCWSGFVKGDTSRADVLPVIPIAKKQDQTGGGGDQAWWAEWLRVLEQEEGNLRAALGFAVATVGCGEHGLHLAAALWPYWLARGALREGRRWLALALEASETVTWQHAAAIPLKGREALYHARAEGLYGSGRLAEQQGAKAQARTFFIEWAALCDALHDEQREP